MGCGAYMLSDAGIYPEGLVPGIHFDTFKDTQDAVSRLRAILNDSGRARAMGRCASMNLETHFSKPAQWAKFCELVA